MHVTVAIPTFDRADVLAITAGVLNSTPWLDRVNLRVFDDASSLTVEQLHSLYPTARQTVKRPENLGADDHARQIFVDFLDTSDDILFLLDSDLVVSEKALDVLLAAMPHTDGVLSLYNSCCHPSQGTIRCGEHLLELKETIGAAGVALTRQRVEDVVTHVAPGRSFDWRFSRFHTGAGRKIFVTHNSYVQHVGFQGHNCDGRVIDFGLSFDCDDPTTKAAIYGVLEDELHTTIRRLQQFDQELGVNMKCIGRILERSIRRPLKSGLRRLFPRPVV